jgi:hypothetical protein
VPAGTTSSLRPRLTRMPPPEGSSTSRTSEGVTLLSALIVYRSRAMLLRPSGTRLPWNRNGRWLFDSSGS